MNFNFCILRHLHNPVSMQKHAKTRNLDLKTILVHMLPWSTFFADFHFLQFDERTRRFKLQSIEVSFCDWGAAKRLMPRSLSALFQRAVLAHEQGSTLEHQIVAQGASRFRPKTGNPKDSGVHLVFRLACFSAKILRQKSNYCTP